MGATTTEALLARLRAALPENSLLTGDDIPPQHHSDWSGAAKVAPLALARPRSTQQIAAVLRACNEMGVPVVPQGGLTGLAGAAQPVEGGIVVALSHFNAIEAIDLAAATVTVQAGATLQALQTALAEQSLAFGVDLGPRGSCQIGGLIACNAGGLGVIQHGTMRAQVLGLEVVLASGEVLPPRPLPKNNTGYDLAQLFIGSEGTLGVVARAVLKVLPAPTAKKTVLLALPDFASALRVLRLLRERLPQRVAAFEIMWADFLQAVKRWIPVAFPFADLPPLAALIDVSGEDEAALEAALEDALGEALEEGWVGDAVIASSLAQAGELWKIRDCIADLFVHVRPVNFDLSVPIARLGDYQAAISAALEARWPGHRAFFFGHIGDGNLHLIVDLTSLSAGATAHDVDATVYARIAEFGASISAEHGVGVLKKEFLATSRNAVEVAAMRRIKRALDPKGIMNPGKIFDLEETDTPQ